MLADRQHRETQISRNRARKVGLDHTIMHMVSFPAIARAGSNHKSVRGFWVHPQDRMGRKY